MLNPNLAPIVLFVYNRPEHTLRTLQALKSNLLSTESLLYIYCDGPKELSTEAEKEKIQNVRKIAYQDKWCGQVSIIENPKNLGLAESIKKGVTEIIGLHDRIIVMEDDLITSPAFLNYMNSALDFYKERKTVFSISAFSPPSALVKVPEDYIYDVYICPRNGSWGWGTWKDRWDKVSWNNITYETIKQNAEIKQAFNRGGDDVFDLLEMQVQGKHKIWSIFFTLAHFTNHAYSILPVKSYVNNIGMDGSGENCGNYKTLDHIALNTDVEIRFADILYEDRRIANAYYSAFCNVKRPAWQKIVNRLSRMAGKPNVFTIKKKIYC